MLQVSTKMKAADCSHLKKTHLKIQHETLLVLFLIVAHFIVLTELYIKSFAHVHCCA